MMFGHLQIYSGYSFQQSTILIEEEIHDESEGDENEKRESV